MITALTPQHSAAHLRETPASAPPFNSDLPRKRQRYVPGGPGGGGRWVDEAAGESQLLPPRPQTERRRRNPATPLGRPRRQRTQADKAPKPVAQPTYNSAADAAAAVQSDGYKPREERSWEEFHPDLDVDVKLMMFTSHEVDGTTPDEQQEDEKVSIDEGVVNGLATPGMAAVASMDGQSHLETPGQTPTIKRKPGRPPRRPEAMLNGLGLISPPAQKITPLPTQNPKERLSLAKPSFRIVKTFDTFEADKNIQDNYVTQSMKNVGYQESDKFEKPRHMIRLDEDALEDDVEDSLRLETDGEASNAAAASATVSKVEYDMDEQDGQWLDAFNIHRKDELVETIKPAIFEITMTQIEKEWHALEKRIPKPTPKAPQTHRPRSGSAAAVNGEPAGEGEEQDSKCAICDDGDCENTNAIVFCDGCDLAVHQECYGVPFIPEGQWLCRKCQQVGRGVPTCIFCPNSDGAFKLTTESRWAHLLCAMWIPEVTLGNHTFMEPIMEVANVPRQRWKLVCYLCNQRMGACIQCGNKNCYQAFHVTCARKAKLFLKMKSAHGGLSIQDASSLKAFCDKHVPPEWRRQHDVDAATAAAKEYYRREMRHHKWADSQQAALSLMPAQSLQPIESIELKQEDETPKDTAAEKKRRAEAERKMWKLPSGAPIVPQVVINAVDNALVRFTIRKRKDFVAEACKYWTLKREARRGAALLKRLQLQMETFSTSEIARRDFAAMGAAGGPRLQRRIEFAELLEGQMASILEICKAVREREAAKLQDADLLKDVVNTVYFPITSMCRPILERAQYLARAPPTDQVGTKAAAEVTDAGKTQFTEGFKEVQTKLDNGWYSSVSEFSQDLGRAFAFIAGLENVTDALEAHQALSGANLREEHLVPDQRDAKKLAKRIAKAAHLALTEALRQEALLRHGALHQGELKSFESILNSSSQPTPNDATVLKLEEDAVHPEKRHQGRQNGRISPPLQADDKRSPARSTRSSPRKAQTSTQVDQSTVEPVNGPPTPPRSEKGVSAESVVPGGIAWYLEGFEPDGLIISDERYDGEKVMREMSEPLSEMDEAQLTEMGAGIESKAEENSMEVEAAAAVVTTPVRRASARKKRKNR